MIEDIEKRIAEFPETFEILEIVGLIFLFMIVSETVWDIISGKRKKTRETMANAAIAFGNVLLDRTLYGLVFILGIFATETYAFFSIPQTWWSWVLALLAADLTYYWMHRFEHEIRILWSYHSVHHNSPEFNLTTSLRLAWVEGLIEWIFFAPMVLIGFDAVQTIVALAIVVIYQTWIHTEKIGRLGWADRVFNTPSAHRVHHASNAKYLDKNYGGILIIWDRIFGTYQAEEEDVVYGVTKPIRSSNPLIINFSESFQIAKDVWRSKNLREAYGYLFRKPGWRPGAE